MRHLTLVALCALVLLAGTVPAFATTACYDWDCDWSTKTCTFDARCTVADPFVWSRTWYWGDGSHDNSGALTSHTYTPAGNDCFANVTLTIVPFSSDPEDSVTCEVIYTLCPFGPQQEDYWAHGHCQ